METIHELSRVAIESDGEIFIVFQKEPEQEIWRFYSEKEALEFAVKIDQPSSS